MEKEISLVIFSCAIFVLIFFIAPDIQGEEIKVVYKVKKGDTLSKIAERFNVDVESILKWNPEKFKKTGEEVITEGEVKKKKITEEDFPKIITPGTKLKIPRKDASGKWIVHEVQPGDTFIQIARDYGVTKVRLFKWNRKLFGYEEEEKEKVSKSSCKTIKGKNGKKKKSCRRQKDPKVTEGMELIIFAERPDLSPRIAVYRTQRKDTPYSIATKFDISLKDFLDFNFARREDVFKEGEIVEIPMPVPLILPVSIGSPESGRLVGGEKMPEGPGWFLKTPSYAYGTTETITGVINCIADVQRKFPNTPDLVIGHLSKKKGGKFKPHKSHASGRDIDVSYYLKEEVKKFVKVTPENFDVKRTAEFVMCLANSGDVEYIFIDRYIQEMLYSYLEKKLSKEALDSLIQFPRPDEKRLGIIRHEDGHDDHMHIRFKCPPTSRNCYD